MDDVLRIHLRRAQAVNARHRRHDDHVAPREERGRRRMAELVDLVVDERLLVDIGIARRNVRLRLVVVVVRNEIIDGVVREKFAELVAELCGEVLLCAITSVGFSISAITFAIVNVFPEPVTPKSTWSR